MEFIKNVAQFEKMIDNKIIGMPKLINSKLNFMGKNNILICDNNIHLENVVLDFNGNNSVVYLGSNLNDGFNLEIYNNSTGFIGKDVKFGFSVSINIFESQNLIIGDDCIIGNNVNINTSDISPIYDINSKSRINFPNSVFIGDHVLIGNNVTISKGVTVGSGSIIGDASFIHSNTKIKSNVYVSGDPAKIIKDQVFFTKNFTGPFKNDDIIDSRDYKSNVFIFNVVNQETLSLQNIDSILKDLDVESRLEFIQKLFITNKRKNRFSS